MSSSVGWSVTGESRQVGKTRSRTDCRLRVKLVGLVLVSVGLDSDLSLDLDLDLDLGADHVRPARLRGGSLPSEPPNAVEGVK